MTIGKKRAEQIFKKQNFTCQFCLSQHPPEGHALHVHHRVFVSQGGKDDEDNMATCCWKCHHNHGALKNRRLKTEKDDSKMNELIERYKTRRIQKWK